MDSVDEINTTDLENWVIRDEFYLMDQEELYSSEEREIDEDDMRNPRIVNIVDFDETKKRIWQDNRVDFARMFLNKGEPYSLKKYKRIFKREMESQPELYDVLDANGEPKEHIDGIIANDERFYKYIISRGKPALDPKRVPSDYFEKLAEWRKLKGILSPQERRKAYYAQLVKDEILTQEEADDELKKAEELDAKRKEA